MSIIGLGFVSIIVGLVLLILTGNPLSYVLIILGLAPFIFVAFLLIFTFLVIEGDF